MVKTVGKVSIQPSGQWVKANTYNKLQLVSNLGSSYLAIQPVPANTEIDNTSYWMMIASKGDKGNTGKSIQTITKTGTVGLVDTYTILYSDLTTSTFIVNNGNGVTNIEVEKTGTSGNVDTYTMTITMASGEPYVSTFTITNGEDGDVQASAIAEPYDNTVSYKVGNLLTYLGKQYYCIADAPAGTLPTNTTYFEEKSVADIIEMIKNGSIVTGHSEVADNLTPYSEDSGTTQENPFISQGTGTDNNSVIVTTGVIARQLEKQGNTVPVMQLVGGARTKDGITATYDSTTNTYSLSGTSTKGYAGVHSSRDIIQGHKYFIAFNILKNPNNVAINFGALSASNGVTTTSKVYTMTGATVNSSIGVGGFESGTDLTGIEYRPVIFDITSWSSSIITDLTSHPEHFSWYYNGSLAYDAGSLQNCNGRYLECGQGRQLWDEEWEQGAYNQDTGEKQTSTQQIRNKTPFIVIANRPVYAYVQGGSNTIRVSQLYFYDANMTFISRTALANNGASAIAPAGSAFVNFQTSTSYGGTYNKPITVSLYYTPEEGGEGYNQHYDYIAPIRIDTGNETLKAFDKKLPSGVIERNTGEVDLSTLTFGYKWSATDNTFYCTMQDAKTEQTSGNDKLSNIICAKYVRSSYSNMLANDKTIAMWTGGGGVYLCIHDSAYSDVETFKTAMSGVMLQYELADASKTTEQGTPFSEYAPINDYSYMAWFDTDGNLVSIPQGCKLFYPVDYKGFVDDLVMYTNGDATALAKNEDITDSALNARGYYKMQDLSSSITDLAGLTYNVKKAYKCGNVVTICVDVTNSTGSSIAMLTPLFDVPSPIAYMVTQARADGQFAKCDIDNGGQVSLGIALPHNSKTALYLTYVTA